MCEPVHRIKYMCAYECVGYVKQVETNKEHG